MFEQTTQAVSRSGNIAAFNWSIGTSSSGIVILLCYGLVGLLLFAAFEKLNPLAKTGYVLVFPVHAGLGTWLTAVFKSPDPPSNNKPFWTAIGWVVIVVFGLIGGCQS